MQAVFQLAQTELQVAAGLMRLLFDITSSIIGHGRYSLLLFMIFKS